MIQVGNDKIGEIYYGSSKIKEVWFGSELVWQLAMGFSLYAWGYNYYGQLGDNTTEQKEVPTQIGTAEDWNMVSAGSNHSLGIRSGKLYIKFNIKSV